MCLLVLGLWVGLRRAGLVLNSAGVGDLWVCGSLLGRYRWF